MYFLIPNILTFFLFITFPHRTDNRKFLTCSIIHIFCFIICTFCIFTQGFISGNMCSIRNSENRKQRFFFLLQKHFLNSNREKYQIMMDNRSMQLHGHRGIWLHKYNMFMYVCMYLCYFCTAPVAYVGAWARVQIRAVTTGHSNM